MNYISRIFAPIESLGMEIQTIQSAMAGVRRIDAFLDQPERMIGREQETAARGDGGVFPCDLRLWGNACPGGFFHDGKAGGTGHVDRPDRCRKEHGAQVCCSGLYPPERGTITIGGSECFRYYGSGTTDRASAVWSSIFSRVPGTVLEQITLGDPRITGGNGGKGGKSLPESMQVIETLPDGYDTVCTEGLFSQGEWQLLSIARAAAADPAVLSSG